MNPDMRRAVADAVSLVNTHSGHTAIRLLFASGADPEVDFVANSAVLRGKTFEFTAGFETYGGSVDELSEISATVIES